MDFSEDFVGIQGILLSTNKTVGDFTLIKHRGGNEQKISTVVDELQKFLNDKKYLRKGKINPKYERALREINFFLILNTDFKNNHIFGNDNKFAHLTDVMPQMSKCLLANIVWSLDLCRFYSEAIYSLPIEISVELLENCNNCIKRQEPYLVLEHVAMLALAIYVKLYNVRNENIDESKVGPLITKLLEKFTEILQNYITPEVDKMSSWSPKEMYQYMGVAITKVLHLLKCCLNIVLNDCAVEIDELYHINMKGAGQTPEKLDRSGQALKKCNICLMSVCEANLQAVTVDVFCAWAEYKHNNSHVQQAIGTLAYEVRQQLESFEGCGNLPSMLDAIKIKPKSIEENIQEADEETLLKNISVPDNNQTLWFKALLKHGIMKSVDTFECFKSNTHLLTKDDLSELLEYCTPFVQENNIELKHCLIETISKIADGNTTEIIAEYYQKSEINNTNYQGITSLYETENFETNLNELFNKLCKGKSIFCAGNLPINEIVGLVLQNPTKFIAQLLYESIKNVDHLSNILKIIEFVKPICLIKTYENLFENSLITIQLLRFLRTVEFETGAVQCLSVLINSLITSEMLNKNFVSELATLVEESVKNKEFKKSITVLKIMQELPSLFLAQSKSEEVINKLFSILSLTRWNFLTFENDKVLIVAEIVMLLRKYKECNSLQGPPLLDITKYNEIDRFYLSNSTDFLLAVSSGYDINGSHDEQVCRLVKLLPNCCPSEWEMVRTYLLKKLNPLVVFQLFIDVFIILSEIFKKPENTKCLSYCFQQICIHFKSDVHPYVQNHRENYPDFMKNICKVLKHLPAELQNEFEISLINLFDESVLRTMSEDKEFICILLSISHLEICQVICTKMVQ